VRNHKIEVNEMPVSPLKACAVSTCNNLAPRGGRFCEEHDRQYNYDAHRENSHRRGYDRNWQKIRRVKLSRDPICEEPGCGRLATDVDHIKPKAQGGTNDYDNLRSNCKSHHSRKTATYDGGFGNKKKVEQG
jgi:5-methylcytosine-specific restriction protein A